MKTVLFLGGGATRAQYDAELALRGDEMRKSLQPGQELLPPPLDPDFIPLAYKRCPEFADVAEYLRREHNLDVAGRNGSSEGMESLFVRVFEDANGPDATQDTHGCLDNLLTAYRKLISVSTWPLVLPPETPVPKLAEHLNREFTIVTTNQDLVAEIGIWNLTLKTESEKLVLPPGTSHHTVYEQPCTCSTSSVRAEDLGKRLTEALPKGAFRRTRTNKKNKWLQSAKQAYALDHRCSPITRNGAYGSLGFEQFSDVLILKLHGSFNWWYESKSPRVTQPIRKLGTLQVCPEEVIPEGPTIDWHWTRHFPRPLVVPPVPCKKRFPLYRFLESVWKKAREELSECEKLIVFGYGFPKTDTEARSLFCKKQLKKVKQIVNINPSQGDTGWLDDEFTCTVKRYRCVDNYLCDEARD